MSPYAQRHSKYHEQYLLATGCAHAKGPPPTLMGHRCCSGKREWIAARQVSKAANMALPKTLGRSLSHARLADLVSNLNSCNGALLSLQHCCSSAMKVLHDARDSCVNTAGWNLRRRRGCQRPLLPPKHPIKYPRHGCPQVGSSPSTSPAHAKAVRPPTMDSIQIL